MRRIKQVLYWGAVLILLAVFLTSAWSLIRYYWESRESQNQYDDLAQRVESIQAQAHVTEEIPTAESPSGATDGTEAPTEPMPETQPQLLPEYAPLYEENSDMVGWIKIENTTINYPVMQTPDVPDFYLDRNFYRVYDGQGCIFADGNCDITESDNVILYGHHMRNGSMFAPLDRYKSETFLEEHPVIRFDSLTHQRTYEIFAVFTTSANYGQGFAYHNFSDAENQEEFDAFVSECLELSLHDTGIVPEYGDQLLCLSTCEYSNSNGRMVVAAVLVK